MQLETLVREFLFECEIREYTPRTVENYKKQLRHFTEFLKEYCPVETLEEVQASHVKAFIKHYQMRQCKPSYIVRVTAMRVNMLMSIISSLS